MKSFLVLFFTLFISSTFGQTRIDSVTYTLSFSDNCYEYHYNFTVPRLRLLASQEDIRKSINDSLYKHVLPLFAATLPEIVTEYYSKTDSLPCDITLHKGPYSLETSYKVLENTNKMLSLVVHQLELEGNGSYGGSKTPLCFNADLVNQELLTFESLFTPPNQKKVMVLFKAEFDKRYKKEGFSFAQDGANIQFVGISTTQKQLIAHFSVYLGQSSHTLFEAPLPWAMLSPRIKKKYTWLYATKKK